MAISILRKFSACASSCGLELDLVELGQAIDQLGDLLAEALGDLGLGDRRVLHHVVQQRGDHACASMRHSASAPATASGCVI
jgi:hypothetical protein